MIRKLMGYRLPDLTSIGYILYLSLLLFEIRKSISISFMLHLGFKRTHVRKIFFDIGCDLCFSEHIVKLPFSIIFCSFPIMRRLVIFKIFNNTQVYTHHMIQLCAGMIKLHHRKRKMSMGNLQGEQ